jgi:hypothetical protein
VGAFALDLFTQYSFTLDPARTKVILSSLINLVNLRDGESELYNDVVQQLIRLTEQREDSVQKIGELTKLIEDRKSAIWFHFAFCH